MTSTGDISRDLPEHVIELCRRHLGGINTVTPLANARHVLFRLSGTLGVGVLKIHEPESLVLSEYDGPSLWLRERTANVLFQAHSQLLDAVPGYLLFKFVDAQPLVRRLTADTRSSLAGLFEQAATRVSEIHRASLELDSDLLSIFPTDPLLALGLGSTDFLSSFKAATHSLSARVEVKRVRRIYEAVAKTIGSLDGIHGSARLIHGDFQPKNLLFDASGGLAAVIDWELARIAPPLCDFATLVRFAPDSASESAIVSASKPVGLSVSVNSARCYDLIRISLSMSKADPKSDDLPLWANYLEGCADSLLENDPEPARAASRELLILP